MRPPWLDTRAYPFATRALEIEGARVHYVDEGDGPTVLFVHGLPTWSFVWRHLIAGLRDRHRCVAPDLPGFGLSDKPAGDAYRPEDQARRLAVFVDALRLKDWALVVHDFGGPIGLSLPVEHPSRERHVRAGKDRQADDVDVLLHGFGDDLLRCALEPRVDDLEARVAQRLHHDLGTAIVAVEARLGDEHFHAGVNAGR